MSRIIPPQPVVRRRKSSVRPDSSDSSGSDRDSEPSTSSEEDDFETPTSPEENSVKASRRDATIFANVMKQSKWKVKISSTNNRTNFDELCSLCLRQKRMETTTGNGNKLIRPCLCEGYRSRHHKRCIEEWIELTGATSCPFCQVRYEFSRTKKSIIDYFRELELHEAFEVNLIMFLFSVYIFLVGLTICYQFINTAHKGDAWDDSINKRTLAKLKSWRELEELVDRHSPTSSLGRTNIWLSSSLFGLTVTGTALLFISIISLCLKFIVTHYLRYLLWSKTNFRVSMEPYRLVV